METIWKKFNGIFRNSDTPTGSKSSWNYGRDDEEGSFGYWSKFPREAGIHIINVWKIRQVYLFQDI